MRVQGDHLYTESTRCLANGRCRVSNGPLSASLLLPLLLFKGGKVQIQPPVRRKCEGKTNMSNVSRQGETVGKIQNWGNSRGGMTQNLQRVNTMREEEGEPNGMCGPRVDPDSDKPTGKKLRDQ